LERVRQCVSGAKADDDAKDEAEEHDHIFRDIWLLDFIFCFV